MDDSGPKKMTYKVRAVAELLDVSPQFVRDEIDRGNLKAIRRGKRMVLIKREELERYLDDQPA